MTSTALAPSRAGAVTARIALVGYLLFVGFTVWLPASVSAKVTGLVGVMATWVADAGIASYERSAVVLEVLANVALFVPVGLLLSFALPRLRLWQVVLTGGLMSVVIEGVQGLMPSRVPALSDVIANTSGTLIGGALALVMVWLVAGDRPAAARRRLVS